MLRLCCISKMYQTYPKASKLCLLLIRYKIRVKYDERAINKGLKKQHEITCRHSRQESLRLSISKPFVKPTKLSIQQLVIIVLVFLVSISALL